MLPYNIMSLLQKRSNYSTVFAVRISERSKYILHTACV